MCAFEKSIENLSKDNWKADDLNSLDTLQLCRNPFLIACPKILLSILNNDTKYKKDTERFLMMIHKWKKIQPFKDKLTIEGTHKHITPTDDWYCRYCQVGGIQ